MTKSNHHHDDSCCCASFLTVILAIFLPPLGVLAKRGCCTHEFWLCLLLTLLGIIPGIIYAIHTVCKDDKKHCDRCNNHHCCGCHGHHSGR
ncbi:hypothetical protein BS78_05G102100 [Paspalum vaginatum]|nr:hypothetical protein BS78_05G102100 [Paspalum vaginatum]